MLVISYLLLNLFLVIKFWIAIMALAFVGPAFYCLMCGSLNRGKRIMVPTLSAWTMQFLSIVYVTQLGASALVAVFIAIVTLTVATTFSVRDEGSHQWLWLYIVGAFGSNIASIVYGSLISEWETLGILLGSARVIIGFLFLTVVQFILFKVIIFSGSETDWKVAGVVCGSASLIVVSSCATLLCAVGLLNDASFEFLNLNTFAVPVKIFSDGSTSFCFCAWLLLWILSTLAQCSESNEAAFKAMTAYEEVKKTVEEGSFNQSSREAKADSVWGFSGTRQLYLLDQRTTGQADPHRIARFVEEIVVYSPNDRQSRYVSSSTEGKFTRQQHNALLKEHSYSGRFSNSNGYNLNHNKSMKTNYGKHLMNYGSTTNQNPDILNHHLNQEYVFGANQMNSNYNNHILVNNQSMINASQRSYHNLAFTSASPYQNNINNCLPSFPNKIVDYNKEKLSLAPMSFNNGVNSVSNYGAV